MDFRILGPLEVLDEGRRVALGGSKQRSLLALLLLHANEWLSADWLIDELWGERPPATASKTLQVHVSGLRKALGAGFIALAVLLLRQGGNKVAWQLYKYSSLYLALMFVALVVDRLVSV